MARDSELHLSELQTEGEAMPFRAEIAEVVLRASVPERFENRAEYVETFTAFLNLEINEERGKRGYLDRSDYEVLWNSGTGATANVRLLSVADLSVRDQLRITDPYSHSAIFRISSINKDASSVLLKNLDGMEDFVMSDNLKYRVEFVATRVHLRMLTGLQQFERGAEINPVIADIILGRAIPEEIPLPANYAVLTPPNHPLDDSQTEAVRFALTRRFALIRGPPGTGKTTTAAAIIYNLIVVTRERILVCAPSNIAVDHLTQSLKVYDNVKPLRIYSKTMIESDGALLAEESALHYAVRKRLAEIYPNTADLLDRRKPLSSFANIPETAISRVEREIVNDYHVICCTCSNTITEYIRSIRFGAVVLDEAGFATEPDALLPVLKGVNRFVMLGDENQLPPFVQSRAAIDIGYGRSMLERLVKIGVPVRQINVQYRMHPVLSAFSNREIYNGELQNAPSTEARLDRVLESFWGGSNPIVFYHVNGVEEAANAFSFYNHKEALLIEELLYRLVQYQINPKDIGIITPYEGQRVYITKLIKEKARVAVDDLEIKNLDGFQGREKRFILFSTVRSNMESEMGFLHNKRRLNVAITRAQSGLVLVGNRIVLGNDRMWKKLIEHIRDLGQLKDGEVLLR